MAKQHKAATEVTVVRDEQSEFAAWLERFWKPMAAVAVLAAVGVLVFQYNQEQRREALTTSWDRIWSHVEQGRFVAGFGGDAEALATAFPTLQGTEAGPWALFLQAKIHADQSEYGEAEAALQRLQELYPQHPLVTERYPIEGLETPAPLVEQMAQDLRKLRSWESGREHLLRNPPPPSDAPRVVLETSEGNIVVAIYSERAPVHGDNFLKLAREGYYDGTRFHRVEPGFMVQGGDPLSREDNREVWGTGGPETLLDYEETELRHFTGYLAAAKPPGSDQSSGSQFYITTAPAHHLDGEHVIFGKVLEGMDVVRKIEAGRMDPSPLRRGQPIAPVTLLSAKVQ